MQTFNLFIIIASIGVTMLVTLFIIIQTVRNLLKQVLESKVQVPSLKEAFLVLVYLNAITAD